MHVVMPFFLSVLMSCVISFVSTAKAIGFTPDLVQSWLKAWGVSWLVAFPTVLVVLPVVRRLAGMVVEAPGQR
jgi:hypothetical protein